MRYLILFTLIFVAGCSATVETYDPITQNPTSKATIPYGYQYSVQDQTLRGDEIIVDNLSQAAIKIIENNPEATAKIAEMFDKK